VSDGLLPLNPATLPGGQVEDVEDLVGFGGAAVIRQRLQWTGALLAEIARVMNVSPTGAEYGGVVRNIPATPTALTSSAQINASAMGDNIVIAGVAATQIRVYRLFLVVGGAVDLKFADGVGTDFCPPMKMASSGAIVLDFSSDCWFEVSAGQDFLIKLSAGVQVSGRIYYTQS
jgi:hypothetical protein